MPENGLRACGRVSQPFINILYLLATGLFISYSGDLKDCNVTDFNLDFWW